MFFCQAVKLQPISSHSETDAVDFSIVWSDLCNNAAICERFSIGEFTSGNEEDGIFPFWGVISYPFVSIPRSLINSFIHISASVTLLNWLYSCVIPVIDSITALALKWLHASCAVRICVVREYLEAIWPSWSDVGAEIDTAPLVLCLAPSRMAQLWVQEMASLMAALFWGLAMAPLVVAA